MFGSVFLTFLRVECGVFLLDLLFYFAAEIFSICRLYLSVILVAVPRNPDYQLLSSV